MGESCMVFCGDWRRPKIGIWEFCLDTERLSRVVRIGEGLSLRQLEEDVVKEFGLKTGDGSSVSLSYWSFKVDGFATSTRTPPVMLTNDAEVSYFRSELLAGNAKNLFVKVKGDMEYGGEGVGARIVDDTGKSVYETPVFRTRRHIDFDLNVEASPSKEPCSNPDIPTVGSKYSLNLIDDDDIMSYIEEEEARASSVSGKSRASSTSAFDLGIETDESDDNVFEVEDVVPTPGFDREFWGPFLDEDRGGSNVVDVMCGDGDINNSNVNRNGEIAGDSGYVYTGGSLNGEGHVDEDVGVKPLSDMIVDRAENSRGNVAKRNLCDIDDEEFDIPPLFDDTKYEAADIPDLDKVNDGQVISVGKVFGCREDLQIALAIYAIKNMFHFTQSRTKVDYVVFTYSDSRCDWRVTAREMKDCGYYKVKKANLEHTCSLETRSRYKEKATSRVIEAVYKAKYGNPVTGPLAMDLQQLVLEDLRVPTSYMKCWRAKEKAISDIWGTDEDSYLNLPTYLHLLKLSNPGTITDFKTEMVQGVEKFKYVFLSFGASIEGFKMLRRVLVVDGTHLSGWYKGVLLTASGQDANFQVFPLAYAVVDSENDEAWTWFLQSVENIIGDDDELTIISNRCQSIYKAINVCFPKANHGACVVHLERNVTSRYKSKDLAKLVGQAAFAYKIGEFNELFKQIKLRSSECAKYLENIGIWHWSRACFKGKRYNLMTSNIAKTLNKALKKGRSSPIVELLRFIQAMMTRWFAARRKRSQAHRGAVPIQVEKVMVNNKRNFVGSTVNRVSAWSFEVAGLFGSRTQVFLDTKKCGCRRYDQLQIPCGHALMAADSPGLSYALLLPGFLKTSSWVATYQGVINLAEDEGNVTIPDCLKKEIRPPRTKRPSGRPKEARIPSAGEIGSSKTGNRSGPNRCGRCRGAGHNRVSCKNPI